MTRILAILICLAFLPLAAAQPCAQMLKQNLELKTKNYAKWTSQVAIEPLSTADVAARVAAGDEFELVPNQHGIKDNEVADFLSEILQLSAIEFKGTPFENDTRSTFLKLKPISDTFVLEDSRQPVTPWIQSILQDRLKQIFTRFSPTEFFVSEINLRFDGEDNLDGPSYLASDAKLHIDNGFDGYAWVEALVDTGTIGLGYGHFIQVPKNWALIFMGSPEQNEPSRDLSLGFLHGRPVNPKFRIFLKIYIKKKSLKARAENLRRHCETSRSSRNLV